MSVLDNTSIASLGKYRSKLRLINHAEVKKDAEDVNKSLHTKTASMQNQIQNLSGGNQQKVILARWLMAAPDILIMDEPTRGIDVGAKYEICTIMAKAQDGSAAKRVLSKCTTYFIFLALLLLVPPIIVIIGSRRSYSAIRAVCVPVLHRNHCHYLCFTGFGIAKIKEGSDSYNECLELNGKKPATQA